MQTIETLSHGPGCEWWRRIMRAVLALWSSIIDNMGRWFCTLSICIVQCNVYVRIDINWSISSSAPIGLIDITYGRANAQRTRSERAANANKNLAPGIWNLLAMLNLSFITSISTSCFVLGGSALFIYFVCKLGCTAPSRELRSCAAARSNFMVFNYRYLILIPLPAVSF